MSPGLRIVVTVVLAMAAALAALWASLTVGVWLALHAATGSGGRVTGTRLVSVPLLVVALVVVAKAVALLTDDLRQAEAEARVAEHAQAVG